MDENTWSNYMLSKRDSLKIQGHKQVESKGTEKDISANSNQKTVRLAILISDQTDFKSKKVTRDKGHYTLIKGSYSKKI